MNFTIVFLFHFFSDTTDTFIETPLLNENEFPIIFESIKGFCTQSDD